MAGRYSTWSRDDHCYEFGLTQRLSELVVTDALATTWAKELLNIAALGALVSDC